MGQHLIAENRDPIGDEISRVYFIAHDPNVVDLLGALLAGYERNETNVKKLRLFAHKWMCSDWPEQEKVIEACEAFLKSIDPKYVFEFPKPSAATLSLLRELEESDNWMK